jgi:flagellar biogenesis protein FliO
MNSDRDAVDAETDRERIRDMIKISAVAQVARVAAFAAFAAGSIFGPTFAGAQEEPGPWMPPAGSVAGPSSVDRQEAPAPSAGSYPPARGPGGEASPRLLAPVYRGPEATASAPHAAPAAANSYADRRLADLAARPPEADYPPSSQSPFPNPQRTLVPPSALPAARIPAPLPPADSSRLARDFDRGFASPSSYATDVSPEADAAPSATGDDAEAKRPLPPKPGPGEALKSSTGQCPYAATFGSLAAVLGAFFIFVWFQKRGSKRGVGALPPEVVEPLGTIPFVSRQALHVVRFGSKILLVNVTIGGSETLAEIDDPREAERILALCRRHRPDSLGRTFREVLGSPRPATGAASNDRSRGAAHA